MPHNSIDVGIDLGTTNSAIAVIQQGMPFIVSADPSQPLTPSVVRVNSGGVITVGQKAKNMLVADPENTAGSFKRWMGTQQVKRFSASGREMTAPQLSSLILQSLRNDARQHLQDTITAAVITVPAAFDLVQCAATQEAARLAGITQAPLLQEPVAASLAYGYRLEMEGQHWLVFDLGGGTFDLALVGVRDGRVQVLDHEGDNFLGGTDFDWLLVERIIIPRLSQRFNVANFSRENPERREALAKLKELVETAKIELSRSDSAIVQVETIRKPMLDDDGREIEADVSVMREEYEAIIAPLVDRAVALSREVLKRHPQISLEAVLMVGGPTLTPLVRRAVAEGLDLPINTSANPLTVVAEGAALHAATQPLAERPAIQIVPGIVTLDLNYMTVTDDDTVLVGCRAPKTVVTLEFAAADRSWSSGQLPVSDGVVKTRLPLPRKGTHKFQVIARAADGTILKTAPETLTVTRALTAAAASLSKTIGVVVESKDGEQSVDPHIAKGTSLPARAVVEYRTNRTLDHGAPRTEVRVHVVEGESPRPARNRKVGDVVITSAQVPRRVPEGQPVEVTIEISESRLLRVEVYIPLLDQSFEATMALGSDAPDAADLRADLQSERERVAELAGQLPVSMTRELHEGLREVERDARAAAGGDPEAGLRALRNLQRVQVEIDKFEDAQRLPRAVAEARKEAEMAMSVVMDHGDDGQKARLHALLRDLDEAVAASSLSEIQRTGIKLNALRWEVLSQQPGFWVSIINYMCETADGWTDAERAEALIRKGRSQIMAEDIEGLRETFFALRELLPSASLTRADMFQNVGIRRLSS